MVDRPNSELMHIYGTDVYYLEKTGAIPNFSLLTQVGNAADLVSRGGRAIINNKPLLREAAIVAGRAALHAGEGANRARQDALMAQAEAMNQAFRQLEANRMVGTISGFGGTAFIPGSDLSYRYAPGGVVADFDPTKMASVDPAALELVKNAGALLAEMEKEALFGGLQKAFTALAGKVGTWAGKIGGSAGKAGGGLFSKLRAPKVPGVPKPPVAGVAAQAGKAKTIYRSPAQLPDVPTTPPVAKPSAAPTAKPWDKPQYQAQPRTSTLPETPKPVSPWEQEGRVALERREAGYSPFDTRTRTAYTPKAPAEAPTMKEGPGLWQRLKPGWGTKAVLGAGALGTLGAATYLGHKGLQSGFNYLNTPTAGYNQWGSGYGPLPTDVGASGYAPIVY